MKRPGKDATLKDWRDYRTFARSKSGNPNTTKRKLKKWWNKWKLANYHIAILLQK